jgi:3-oxoadipate enol-lactonase
MYYEVHGEGEPLILISGLGGDHTFWQPSVEVLKTRYRVMIYDIRGIGKTDAPAGPYSMEVFADDLAGLMDVLQIEKANILGFSMGGNIAQAFVLRYPERVSKLMIAVSFAVMNKQTRLFLDAVLSVYEGGATTKQMFNLIAPWLFSNSFLSNSANAAFLHFDENEPDQQPLYAWKAQYEAQKQFDSRGMLHQIGVPVLMMAGTEDRLAHPEDSELLAARIPGAAIKVFPGSGHLINYEQPELFHQSILDFLQ